MTELKDALLEKRDSDDDSTYDDEVPKAKDVAVKGKEKGHPESWYNDDYEGNTNFYPSDYKDIELRDKRIFPNLKKGSLMPVRYLIFVA